MATMSTSAKAAYDDLMRRSRERQLLISCSSLLGWDEQTYMPPGGSEARGNQLALLAGLHHDRAADPRVGDLLGEVEASNLIADPESPEGANLREWRRSYDRQTKLPKALVEELARATTRGQHEWVIAKRKNDFPGLKPALDAIFQLKDQLAQL